VVLLLCLLGAIHVYIFTAAFPFFSAVDEQVHIDLVVRYSHGEIPRSLMPASAEVLPFLATFGSPQYLTPASALTNGQVAPPPWKQPMATVRDQLAAKEVRYERIFKNHEAASPPLYYALGGAWWRLGRILGLDGIQLLYWLRFLNIPIIVCLVWLGWLTARQIFPENKFAHLALPALVAVLPQSGFYEVNNDVLLPLTFGLVFLFLLKFFEADQPSPGLAAAVGASLAAAFLTKTSNLPLLAVAGFFVVVKVIIQIWRGRIRKTLVPLLILLLIAVLPMVAWMAWCKTNFGDVTGSNLKIQFLGWTDNPRSNWSQHPLFTLGGSWYFLKQNLSTFWQGEMLWLQLPLAQPAVDLAYVVLSLGLLALTLSAMLSRPSPLAPPTLAGMWCGLLCLLASFAFFAWLSLKFDFQACYYPSREQPYFVSGRLMLGMLLPFLALYVCGFDRLLGKFGTVIKLVVLIAMLGYMVSSEITTDLPVFSSEYNWFHL